MTPTSDAGVAGTAADIRRSRALLLEAQAVRRRLEKLTTLASEAPPSLKRLLDEALVAVQRRADDLARPYSAGSSMPTAKIIRRFTAEARNASASAYSGDAYQSLRLFMLGNSATITV